MEQQVAKKPFYKKWWVWVVIVVLFFWVIGVSSKDDQQAEPQSATPTQTPPTPVAKIPQKQISYEIVDRWTIPNGGEGKVVVVSPEYLNESDMTALGEKLRNDTSGDRNANISVFDDKKAALLRDKVLSDEATKAEEALYEKHFIAQYTKNGNTGYHQYVIYLDGVMGTNQKTIKY